MSSYISRTSRPSLALRRMMSSILSQTSPGPIMNVSMYIDFSARSISSSIAANIDSPSEKYLALCPQTEEEFPAYRDALFTESLQAAVECWAEVQDADAFPVEAAVRILNRFQKRLEL